MLKRILFFLVFSVPAFADTVTMIAQLRPSVVAVATAMPTRRPPVVLRATGFVVADGHHVITNYHVIRNELDKDKNETLLVLTGRGDEVRSLSARIIARDEKHDLALLRFDGAALKPVILDGGQVAEGEECLFTGFPLGAALGLFPVSSKAMVSAVTRMATPAPSSQQLNAQLLQQLRDPFDILQLDASAFPGNSGSPLYRLRDGNVIGVVSSGMVKENKEHLLEKPSNIAYAIPVNYVLALIKSAGLTPENEP